MFIDRVKNHASLIYSIYYSLFQKQLAEFDAMTEDELLKAEQDSLPSLEVKHAYARLELRERQLQELAGTMKDLTTEEV